MGARPQLMRRVVRWRTVRALHVHRRSAIWAYYSVIAVLAVAASLGRPVPALSQTPVPGTEPVPAAERHVIWEALLTYFASPETRAGPLVLMEARLTSHEALDPVWLEAIITASRIAGVCPGREPRACPDSVRSTFLVLADPSWTADSTATLRFEQHHLNPLRCRTEQVPISRSEHLATVQPGERGWRVVEVEPRYYADGMCNRRR
jgi:hypothetical protein